MTVNDEQIHESDIRKKTILDSETAQARFFTDQVHKLRENKHSEMKTQEGVSCGDKDVNAFISANTSDAEISQQQSTRLASTYKKQVRFRNKCGIYMATNNMRATQGAMYLPMKTYAQ